MLPPIERKMKYNLNQIQEMPKISDKYIDEDIDADLESIQLQKNKFRRTQTSSQAPWNNHRLSVQKGNVFTRPTSKDLRSDNFSANENPIDVSPDGGLREKGLSFARN